MGLVVKWNLSDACASDILQFSRKICGEDIILPSSIKQGRQFLDKMVVPHLHFQKTVIMTYQHEEYYLYHRLIFDAVKELLENHDIFEHCTFDYTPLYCEGERIYGEQYNSEWWERVQRTIPNNGKVLSIILYSDATTCDHLGKSSEHPVYLTLGNIPTWRRNRPDAKVLLSYLPRLKSSNTSTKRSPSFRSAKQCLYQHAFDILTQPLLNYQHCGFDLQRDDISLWCFSFISILLGDLPENAALTLTYNSINCKYPCHQCLTPVGKLNDVGLNKDQITSRTPHTMKNAVARNLAKQYSLHNIENVFWKHQYVLSFDTCKLCKPT